jgi:hypothetical protein
MWCKLRHVTPQNAPPTKPSYSTVWLQGVKLAEKMPAKPWGTEKANSYLKVPLPPPAAAAPLSAFENNSPLSAFEQTRHS